MPSISASDLVLLISPIDGDVAIAAVRVHVHWLKKKAASTGVLRFACRSSMLSYVSMYLKMIRGIF